MEEKLLGSINIYGILDDNDEILYNIEMKIHKQIPYNLFIKILNECINNEIETEKAKKDMVLDKYLDIIHKN